MRIKFDLSIREFNEVCNSITTAQNSDVEFANIKDRKIRKIFKDAITKRHKLWLKLIHTADKQICKGGK